MKDITNKWIQKANGDLKVVEHELKLKAKERVNSAICFHAQQAAEKFLKAFLIEKNENIGKTHDIVLLLKLCAKYDNDFEKIDGSDLNYYAVQVRYPDEFIEPTFEQTEKCWKKSKEIIDLIKKKLKM